MNDFANLETANYIIGFVENIEGKDIFKYLCIDYTYNRKGAYRLCNGINLDAPFWKTPLLFKENQIDQEKLDNNKYYAAKDGVKDTEKLQFFKLSMQLQSLPLADKTSPAPSNGYLI